MKKRLLGSSKIEVSEIAFGGVEIGLPYGVNKRVMEEAEAITLLRTALDMGLNFFDTARLYGNSEERIGKAFKGIREKAVISTKCAHLQDAAGQVLKGKALTNFVEDSIAKSFQALQTDFVDVFMVHWASSEILKNAEIAEVFRSLKKRGLARTVGVSTYGLEDTSLALESGNWDVVQLSFNLMDQSCIELFPVAKQKGIGLMVRSVLMRGILTDGQFNYVAELQCIKKHKEKYKSLLSADIVTISDLAIKFALSFEDISSVLIGIDKTEFLTNAVSVANGCYLPPSSLRQAKQMAYPDPEFLNMAVWDRKGWLK